MRERLLPERARLPTHVYIDESADYFDRNIGLILSSARKYKVGMVLAHQYLGQLDPKLLEAFAANTSIKFAGGVSSHDAKAFAGMMGCEAELIEAQGKGCFAASFRGLTKTALPIEIPLGFMEAMPAMTGAEFARLRDRMREKYAVPLDQPAPRSNASPSSPEKPSPSHEASAAPEDTDDAPKPWS